MNTSPFHSTCGIALAAVSVFFHAIALQAAVPSDYDLRDHGWITPTKDQGPLGTCWAFASTTAFQGSLLRNGVVDGPQSESLDVSIWHLATHNGVSDPDLTYPYDSWGGDNDFTESYVTRGRGEWDHADHNLTIGGGYVLNSEDPLNVYPMQAVMDQEDLGPYVPPVDQALANYRLRSSFNYRYQEAGAPDSSYRQSLQQAIVDRGAVSATMFAGGNTPETAFNEFYNSDHDTFQVTGSASTESANHMIVLAGWDDDKAVYDKDGVHISTGAWLVQNSWGEDFGDDGYFWIGYDDPIATKEADSFLAGDRSVPGQPGVRFTETVLQNQVFAPQHHLGHGTGTPIQAVSKLSFTESLFLAGIGLWSNEEALAFSLGIYTAWNSGPQDLLFEDDYLVDGIGYKEVLFDLIAFDSEDVIYVLIDFGDAYAEPVAVDALSLGLEGVDSFLGLSWVLDSDDQWLDLATVEDYEGIFFTKGLTATAIPEPALWGAAPLVLALFVVRRHRVKNRLRK